MTAEGQTIPDDMAALVARLINEAEDMRQQAADDLKQIYADLREELKALGWDGKHVSAEVAALKGAVGEMRLDDKAKEKREVRGERIDDYVDLLTRARARKASPRKAAEAVSERNAFQVEADASAEATIEGQPSLTVATSAESAGEAVSADLPTNSKTDAAISRPGFASLDRPEIENRSGEEPSVSNGSGEMQDECAIHLPTNSEIATASHGEAEAHAPKDVSLPVDDRSGDSANTGGDHVDGSASRAGQADRTSNNGEVRNLPNSIRVLRRNCQQPTMCRSGTRDHCHSCKRAMQESAA